MADQNGREPPATMEVPVANADQVRSVLQTVQTLLTGGVFVAIIAGVLYVNDIKGDVKALTEKVIGLEKSLEQHRKSHETGVGSKVINIDEQEPPTAPSGSVIPIALSASAPPSVDAPGDFNTPDACMYFPTKTRVSCDLVKACKNPSEFHPNLYQQWRQKVGAEGRLMVCYEERK